MTQPATDKSPYLFVLSSSEAIFGNPTAKYANSDYSVQITRNVPLDINRKYLMKIMSVAIDATGITEPVIELRVSNSGVQNMYDSLRHGPSEYTTFLGLQLFGTTDQVAYYTLIGENQKVMGPPSGLFQIQIVKTDGTFLTTDADGVIPNNTIVICFQPL